MTDDQTPVEAEEPQGSGLGWIESPPDDRDFQIDALYAAMGIEPEPELALPAAYVVPALPPVLNQGTAPQCVAFSSEVPKSWQDRHDQGRYFPFDERKFFARIGGGPNGAVLRYAFDEMLKTGYPLDVVDQASQHKIRAYYRVPVDRVSLMNAIKAFGPVVLGMRWASNWFTTNPNGTLKAPSGNAGGHAIAAIGWDSRGLRLRNSWGPRFGLGGDCFLPWSYLGHAGEAWKSVDVIEKPPAPTPVDPSKYVHTVKVTASPYVNIRATWSAKSADVGNANHDTTISTTQIKRHGGAYIVGGRTRTDWLGFVRNGRTVWVAAGFTKLIK